jgi:hypothetical protein
MSQTPETGQPARKRRWFRFHLSTAIILMFVAGGLIWANLKPHETVLVFTNWEGKPGFQAGAEAEFGWPLLMRRVVGAPLQYLGPYYWTLSDQDQEQQYLKVNSRCFRAEEFKAYAPSLARGLAIPTDLGVSIMGYGEWYPWGRFVNAAVALAILLAVAFVCEWFVRRRERHQ